MITNVDFVVLFFTHLGFLIFGILIGKLSDVKRGLDAPKK